MKNYRYEAMRPAEFLEAIKACPVVFVPTGLMEWHADHLPLGLDSLKIHAICLEIAKKLEGGIVMPVNYIGRPGFSSYTGTLTYSEGLVQQLFYETFTQLKKVGAKVIVLITGHYGPLQEEAVVRAGEIFRRENPDVSIISKSEYFGALVDGAPPCDHAGKWETSMYMHLYPDDAEKTRSLLNRSVARMKIYENPPHDYYKESEEWFWVNEVENSSPEIGERAVQAIVDVTVGEILSALKKI